MEIVKIIGYVILALMLLSVLYRCLPHRRLVAEKPRFALFPKYVFPNNDPEVLRERLNGLGFRPDRSGSTFSRGHLLGDFLGKWVQLNVVIKENRVFLHAPLIVILFDTGDLWTLGAELSADVKVS